MKSTLIYFDSPYITSIYSAAPHITLLTSIAHQKGRHCFNS